MTWTGTRSSFVGQMVKPFFRCSHKKWILGIRKYKMVTTGRLSMYVQKASKLSKQWGPPHRSKQAYLYVLFEHPNNHACF